MNKRALVIGAGYVGMPLALECASKGWDTHVVKYSPVEMSDNLKPYFFDIRSKQSWQESGLFSEKPFDIVFFLPAPAERSEKEYQEIYIRAFDNYLETAMEHNKSPARIIFISSTAVYPQDNGEIVQESAEIYGKNPTSKILWEAEKNAQKKFPSTVIARFAGLYGPERAIYMNNFSRWLHRNEDPAWVNLLHRQDAIRALLFLAHSQWAGDTFNVSGLPALRSQILSVISGLIHEPLPPGWVPHDVEVPVGIKGKRIDNTKLIHAGFNYIYPNIEMGFTQILQN